MMRDSVGATAMCGNFRTELKCRGCRKGAPSQAGANPLGEKRCQQLLCQEAAALEHFRSDLLHCQIHWAVRIVESNGVAPPDTFQKSQSSLIKF